MKITTLFILRSVSTDWDPLILLILSHHLVIVLSYHLVNPRVRLITVEAA